MASRLETLIEGERRGLLNDRQRAFLKEARSRGLAGESTPIESFARGALEGTVEMGPVVAGAVMGGKLGAAAGALTGPAAPVAVPGLAVVGAVGGGIAGMFAAEPIVEGVNSLGLGTRDAPEMDKPFTEAGRTFGQSIPVAALPLGAVARGAQGGIFEPILNAARTSPGTFAAIEAVGAGGAAAGRGVAEAIAPGDEFAGTSAEIFGGITASVASPVALIARAMREVGPALKRASQMFSRSGRETAAGKQLRKLLDEGGEDIPALIARLEAGEDIPGLSFTAGQKSDSAILLAIEQKLLKKIPGLDKSVQENMVKTIAGLNRAYDLAVGSGDPSIIKQISQERFRLFERLIQARASAAGEAAIEAAAKIKPRGQRVDVSRQARVKLESALTDARDAERTVWNTISKDIEVEPQGLQSTYLDVRSQMLEEETLPAPIEAFMRRVGRALDPEDAPPPKPGETPPEPEIITSGDLLRLRSRANSMARSARGGNPPDFDMARRLQLIADGALDDLGNIPGTDEARAFSKALNDVLTRGEAGSILGFDPRGGLRVEPELTLQASIGRGGIEGDVAARQLEEATQLKDIPGEHLPRRSILSEQEDFLRSMFVQVIDNSGKVNPKALDRMVRKNAELLERFPGLRVELTDAVSAQKLFERAARIEGESIQAVKQRAAFAKVAQFEEPTQAIGNILRGPQPLRHFREISRIARSSGPGATAGLRRVTFDFLFDAAKGKNGLISGKALRDSLDKKSGGKSLLDAMLEEKVLTATQADGILRVISRTERFETAITTGRNIGDVIDDAGALEDLLIRVVGANIGGASVVGGVGGAPIVAAGAGSRFARTLAEKVPGQRVEKIMVEAIENPRFMAQLLRKSGSPAVKRQLMRQMNAFLIQAALPGGGQELEPATP